MSDCDTARNDDHAVVGAHEAGSSRAEALPNQAGRASRDLDRGALKLLKRDLEAVLFAAGRPLLVEEMVRALAAAAADRRTVDSQGETPDHDELDPAPETVRDLLSELAEEFPAGGERGFELVQLAGGWAMRTNAHCRRAVSALFESPEEVTRLSPAAMECLAIIAYLQPVSRPHIAEVRGVNSDSPVRTLLERELVTEVGRDKGGAGAILYGTTPRFEAMFGLASLDDLPALQGFALTEEQKEDLRRRLGLLTVPE